MVREGQSVVDAGANIGVVSGQLAQAVGLAGRVHSFEPLPVNIQRLNGSSQMRV